MTDPVQTTTIDLLRHGEVEGGNYYRGQVDDALTEKGWQQMLSAVAHHKPWQSIISSSLSRCSQFALHLAEQHHLPLQVSDELREIQFGQWQGKTAAELMETNADKLKNYWENPESFTPPGAESVTDFRQRISRAWHSLLAEHKGKQVLLISHGGVMAMILSEVLAIPTSHLLRLDIKHAALSRVAVDHYQQVLVPRLVFHNGQL